MAENFTHGINEENIGRLTEQYGNAFYIFNPDGFEENYLNLLNDFKTFYENSNVAYSCKTNYLPQCLKIVLKNGGYAEVVSDMELEIAHLCGFSDHKIIWNGPIKEPKALEGFLLSGGLVNIDNGLEWNLIKEIAVSYEDTKLRIGLRCNYDTGDGVTSRFGIDIASNEFKDILHQISEQKNIELVSLQCHFAKRKSKYWEKRTLEILKVYDNIRKQFSISPQIIDLGGGISGNMSESFKSQIGSTEDGPKKFAFNSARLVNDFFNGKDDKPLLLTEPGTALAADSMSVLFRVENIKCVRGKWIATVNGSQKNISMNGLNPPIHIIHTNLDSCQTYENLDFAGYTCIESDYLYQHYNGKLAVGDFIILDYCGSYSLVSKPPFIKPNIPVIGIPGNKFSEAALLKREETVEDILQSYYIDRDF